MLQVVDLKDISISGEILENIKPHGTIVLWEKEDYDKVGQWTDEDVHNRIIQLFVK